LPTKWRYQRWLATTQPVDWSASSSQHTIRWRPCADPVQKRVPGEWMTQKGVDSKARYRRVGKGKAPGRLARSAGGSPARVRPSKPPGGECCVSLRQRRPRSVHSCSVGCVIEPRNTLIAGGGGCPLLPNATWAVTVSMVMRGTVHPAGVEEHITRGKIVSETGISRVWPMARCPQGPHREGEEL
jgi:hypothetical protein